MFPVQLQSFLKSAQRLGEVVSGTAKKDFPLTAVSALALLAALEGTRCVVPMGLSFFSLAAC